MDELSARGAGRSVKLFLADGTAHGIVIAEMGNWTEAAACVKKAAESGYEVPQAFLDEIAENLK